MEKSPASSSVIDLNVRVHFTDDDEVKELRAKTAQLQAECARLQGLYQMECDYNFRLQEILRFHNLPIR